MSLSRFIIFSFYKAVQIVLLFSFLEMNVYASDMVNMDMSNYAFMDPYQNSMCKKSLNVNESGVPQEVIAFGEEVSADFLVVRKKQRQLVLMNNGKVIKTFQVALGTSPEGKKTKQGDNKTPEGLYRIGYKNSASSYHLSLEIDYPNQDDIDRARKNGVSPGGDIMIHGLPNSKFKRAFINHPKQDWTRGCVAVTDSEIEDIWSRVRTGTPIEICP